MTQITRMKKILLSVLGLVLALTLNAEIKKDFPAHWGKPPEVQTMDYVEWPAGYGHGSSTLRHWIQANLLKDQAAQGTNAAPAVLYANDFEKAELGQLPDGFMVLGGEFAVQRDGTNQVLELPGAPLDSFGMQFGPALRADVAVTARVFSTNKGRRVPTFGVGLGGVSGWKAQVAPGKKTLELIRDLDVKASVPFAWKSGTWTQLRLELRQVKEGDWQVTAKAWEQGTPEPENAMVSFAETEAPTPGRPSIIGSPFAGTPIWYDDLQVLALPPQGASAAR
jgi:hypothetical protein